MSLSTHVLDTARGRPAAGVAVELRRDGDLLVSTDTDADGRAQLRRRRKRATTSSSSRSATTSASARSWTGSRSASRSRIRRALPRAAARLALGVQHVPRQLTRQAIALSGNRWRPHRRRRLRGRSWLPARAAGRVAQCRSPSPLPQVRRTRHRDVGRPTRQRMPPLTGGPALRRAGDHPTLPTPAATARTVAVGVLLAPSRRPARGWPWSRSPPLRLLASGDARLTFDGVVHVAARRRLRGRVRGHRSRCRPGSGPHRGRRRSSSPSSCPWPGRSRATRSRRRSMATIAVGLSLGRDRRCPGGRASRRLAGGPPRGRRRDRGAGLRPPRIRPTAARAGRDGATGPRPQPRLSAPSRPIDASPSPGPAAVALEPDAAAAPDAAIAEPAPSGARRTPPREPAAPAAPDGRLAANPPRPRRPRPPRSPRRPRRTPRPPDAPPRPTRPDLPRPRHARAAPTKLRPSSATTTPRSTRGRFEDAWARLSPAVRRRSAASRTGAPATRRPSPAAARHRRRYEGTTTTSVTAWSHATAAARPRLQRDVAARARGRQSSVTGLRGRALDATLAAAKC